MSAGANGDGAALEALVGRDVVLDTRGPLVYIGVLGSADTHYFTLTDVDVHDMHDGHAPKEKYILDARKYGIKKNRARVLVRRDEVVSLSLLEDVIDY
jgi:hypothetical protein